MARVNTVVFTPRIVTRYISIIVKGKKKQVRSEKLFLDFNVASVITGPGGTFNESRSYTAHIYSSGRDVPEIRVKDPSGDARDMDKGASRTLDNFVANNKWMGDILPGIIQTITDAHADKLAKSIERYLEKMTAPAELAAAA